MSVKTCPDCDAPVGEDMWPTTQHGCWYRGQLAEQMRREGRSEEDIANMYQSSADDPCSHNAYEKGQAALNRRSGCTFLAIPLVMLAAVLLLLWIFG